MDEFAKVTLSNEMDLILAHRRTMKLAELAGQSLAAQTTFATAVSEIARFVIEQGQQTRLILGLTQLQPRRPALVACFEEGITLAADAEIRLSYAQRLVDQLVIDSAEKGPRIQLYCYLPINRRTLNLKPQAWLEQLEQEPPLSPYEEIKRKNDQLREMAERLRKSEQHYASVNDSLPLMIFSASKERQLHYANASLTQYTGLGVAQLNKNRWQSVVHPDDFALLLTSWAEASTRVNVEYRLRRGADQVYEWHWESASVKQGDEAEALWTGFIVNIQTQKNEQQMRQHNTELSQAKSQLEEYQRQLEASISDLQRSNENLQQFAYIASHDLQEPLRKIQSFGDLIKSQFGAQLGEGVNYLNRMQFAAGRMSTLIKDLLSYSRISTRQEPRIAISLDEVINAVLADLEMQIQDCGAQLTIAPLPTVHGEATQLGQLFLNLLSNALKFRRTDQAGQLIPPVIRIEVHQLLATMIPPSVKPTRSAASYYRIDVTDEGIGFSEQHVDRIFQIFQRLHTKAQYVGTGIGLAICEKVVANHGGAITATSQLGQGSSFQVYLPCPVYAEVP